MSKPILRSACRDIDNTDEILSSKSGIRNITGLLAILIINIVVTFMNYDSQIVTLVDFIRWFCLLTVSEHILKLFLKYTKTLNGYLYQKLSYQHHI